MVKPYNPTKYKPILARAWEHVRSVPYPVSARWLFYRLLQEGYFRHKGDYKLFVDKALSPARKKFYEGWRPDTLVDDTRELILRGHGPHNPQGWLDRLLDPNNGLACKLHKWQGQDQYVMLWFEARAMIEQFRYYAPHLDLAPFAGSASIPFKWDIAQHIGRVDEVYNLPVVVLYFGDYDTKGLGIPYEALTDVQDWCDVEFEFIRVGLGLEDATRFNLPENPEKPGEYQWEALTDDQARELIEGAINPYVDYDRMAQVVGLEDRATQQVKAYLAGLKLED